LQRIILYYTEKKLSSAFLPNAKLESEFLFFEFKPLMVFCCKGIPFMHERLKTFLGLEENLVSRWPSSPEKLTGTPARVPARDRTVDDGSICRGKKRYLRTKDREMKMGNGSRDIIVISVILFYHFKERIQCFLLSSCSFGQFHHHESMNLFTYSVLKFEFWSGLKSVYYVRKQFW